MALRLNMLPVSIIVCPLVILTLVCNAKASEVGDPFPHAAASYLLKVNGKTIWAHKPNKILPPASLTKIMTALIVLDKVPMDKIIVISKDAMNETGTRLGLKSGDKIYAGYLLAAMLIQSANDACHALAEYAGGSYKRFVNMMNSRAKEIGLKKTHFTNACGHDQKGHYSTAHDLAILAETALKNPVFAELVSIVRDEITTIDGIRTFVLENANQLIGRYPGAIGVKTGYTLKAGKSLIALAVHDEKRVMLVMLNAPDRWWDAVAMLDKAFAYVKQF